MQSLRLWKRCYYNKVTLVGRLGKDPEFYEFKAEHQTNNVVGKWQFNYSRPVSFRVQRQSSQNMGSKDR
jgi:single-stranded DNA-binding protein